MKFLIGWWVEIDRETLLMEAVKENCHVENVQNIIRAARECKLCLTCDCIVISLNFSLLTNEWNWGKL